MAAFPLSLIALLLCPLAAVSGVGTTSKTKAVEFADVARVPFELEVPILADGPAVAMLRNQQPLVELLQSMQWKVSAQELQITLPGASRPLKIKAGRKGEVVHLPSAGAEVPVLLFSKQQRWFAAPALMLSSKTGLGLVEFLDVDFDGKFDSELDFLAWRGGRLRLRGGAPMVHSENALHGVELVENRGKLQVQLTPSALPEEVSDEIRLAWFAANEFRNQVGLEPVALDVRRNDAALKHSKYLQINGGGGAGKLNVHDEISTLPGYTPEGKQAANGNVMWKSSGSDLKSQPDHEIASLFHRSEYLYPSKTMGAGADGGYSVIWMEEGQMDNARWLQSNNMKSRWVMVPAAGQINVPRRAKRDNPIPASVPNFYQQQRGWPISVASSFKYNELGHAKIELFDAKGKRVQGFAITMADAGFTNQGFQAHYLFAAEDALQSNSKYRAEFTARLKVNDRPLQYSWTFETGK